MQVHRLRVRFPALSKPGDGALETAIGVFHRLLQRGLLEGLLLDVADYRHIPGGPGVLLIGHDVDYGVSARGFFVLRKRAREDDAATQTRDALRLALGALHALAQDGALKMRFDVTRATLSVFDRRHADARGEDHARAAAASDFPRALEAELTPVLRELFGATARVARANEDDPRAAVSFALHAPDARAGAVLEKLGGARPPGQSPWDISVEELARLRAAGDALFLLDVREANEYETVNLGGELAPLASLGEKLASLPKTGKLVVHCKSGGRGARAVQQLRDAGFENAWNLNGGLLAWIERVDPSLARY